MALTQGKNVICLTSQTEKNPHNSEYLDWSYFKSEQLVLS